MTARIAFIGAAIIGLLAIILTLLPVRATPVHSMPVHSMDEPLMCSSQTEGMLSRQAGKVCECVFRPAEKARKLPDRFAWDCGIKRPSNQFVPANLDSYPYVLPEVVVVIDHDKKSEHQKKD